MLTVVLSYPMHPEDGVVTIPFPIPEAEYCNAHEGAFLTDGYTGFAWLLNRRSGRQ